MPLSPSEHKREKCHTRSYHFEGYEREDGLFDIEGQMVDLKPYSFSNHDRGLIPEGEPLHEMWIRLSVDRAFVVHDIEVVTDYAPYTMCPGITENYERMKGSCILKGWTRSIRQNLGGIQGCTHHNEMLRAMGTVAFQTIFPSLQATEVEKDKKSEGSLKAPQLLNSCHAYAVGSEVTRRLFPELDEEKVSESQKEGS